jgi:hypothetical protein
MVTIMRKPDDGWPAIFRFTAELIAWVATPWALARHSVVLAVVSVVGLIGLPTVFGTPGDKKRTPAITVSGTVTIALVLVQLVAAVWSTWVAWPSSAALITTLLAIVVVVTEQPRWRWLIRQPSTQDS